MNMEQHNQELITKWTTTGYLRDIKPQFIQRAAERLENAQRQSCGGYNRDAFDKALEAMEREGYFCSRSVNSNRRGR